MWSSKASAEFRSSERSWYWRMVFVYKYFTPIGVKSENAHTTFSRMRALLAELLGERSGQR